MKRDQGWILLGWVVVCVLAGIPDRITLGLTVGLVSAALFWLMGWALDR